MDNELVHLGGERLAGDAADEGVHRLNKVDALAALAKVPAVARA